MKPSERRDAVDKHSAESAVEEQWRKNLSTAKAAAKRVGCNPAQAEEVAATAAREMWGRDDIDNYEAFAWTVGTRRAKSLLRKEARQLSPIDPSSFESVNNADPRPSPEEQVVRRLILEELIWEVQRSQLLSVRQRETFMAWIRSEGHMGDAIRRVAEETGRDEGTLRTHLSRAIKKLREMADDLNSEDK